MIMFAADECRNAEKSGTEAGHLRGTEGSDTDLFAGITSADADQGCTHRRQQKDIGLHR
jgi:hypothetical protein